jgi:uncharacterized membrane protein YdjX (TVP38/TMEM64 family)
MSDPPPTRAPAWLRLLPLALIAALFVALIASDALKELSLASLERHREALTGFVALHPIASVAAFLGVYLLVVIACTPGPAVLTVASGFLFGPLLGGSVSLTALVCGGVIVFLACRTAFGDWAAHRAGPIIARIEAGFARDAFAYMLALRLMPVAPFFAVNLAAGLARVRLGAFVLATLIGSAPSAFIFASLGAGLGALFDRHAKLGLSLAMRPDIAVPLAALALLSLAPPLWRLWRGRHSGSVARTGGV